MRAVFADTELLNYFGARGQYFRSAAAKLVERMHADQSIQILPQTHEGFLAGCRLYQARLDKGYSLTDCISMEAMRRIGFLAYVGVIFPGKLAIGTLDLVLRGIALDTHGLVIVLVFHLILPRRTPVLD